MHLCIGNIVVIAHNEAKFLARRDVAPRDEGRQGDANASNDSFEECL